MKKLLKIILALFFLMALGLTGYWFYLKSTGPEYEGTVDLDGMTPVDVVFDEYGIPHIYADDAESAYRALGYVHAQERLFQMEMIRRLVSGRLSEILGDVALPSDRKFLNLRLRAAAQRAADKWFANEEDPMVKEAKAYLHGINDFIDHGKTPIEFRLLKIPKRHFKPVDIYTTIMYMTIGFTAALDEEPVLTKIRNQLGSDYLKGWEYGVAPVAEDTIEQAVEADVLGFFSPLKEMEALAIPVWEGSNGWVLAPEKSLSGKVILANDTHIKFSQPSVWYEAHLEYPGFSFYGNFLAGVPFAPVGHNRRLGWGLTIFTMDNMDLYREKVNPEMPAQVWVNDHWEDMDFVTELIPVKGKKTPDTLLIAITRHGPVLSYAGLKQDSLAPLALQWSALKIPTKFLQAARMLAHSSNMDEARQAASQNDILGLNVLYGDIDGNIAKWSTGKIPIRPEGVTGRFILDGASGKDEWLGFYDFSENPRIENPACGFVASSNEAPPLVHGRFYSGFYPAEGRKQRLVKRLTEREKWNIEQLKSVHLDDVSDVHQSIAQSVVQALPQMKDKLTLQALAKWNGEYDLNSAGGVAFSRLSYEIMKLALRDELGGKTFDKLRNTYLFKNNYRTLIPTDDSPWWDDVSTKDKKETRKDILAQAVTNAEKDLVKQFGKDLSNWKWGQVHTLTHVHPIGRKKPFDKYFNVGPFPVPASNGVLNKLSFVPTDKGRYEVNAGPALRILLDFNDVEHSVSINPTGQSGSIFSPHYRDQAQMYVDGKYRLQKMNEEEIRENGQILHFK